MQKHWPQCNCIQFYSYVRQACVVCQVTPVPQTEPTSTKIKASGNQERKNHLSFAASYTEKGWPIFNTSMSKISWANVSASGERAVGRDWKAVMLAVELCHFW